MKPKKKNPVEKFRKYLKNNSKKIPEIDVEIKSEPVRANPRKLKATWTFEGPE